MYNKYNDDYYAILEIPPTASQSEIRSAYLRLSKIHHPDLGGSTEMMQRINIAYSILHNPSERKRYNLWHSQTFKNSNYTNTANSASSASNSASEPQYVYLNLLDYKRGYSRHRVLLSDCGTAARGYLYGCELYAYVNYKFNDEISFIEKEAFFQLRLEYDSVYVLAKIIDGNKVHDCAEELCVYFISNNYKKFLTPFSNVIYVKATGTSYEAIEKEEYDAICKHLAKKSAKRKKKIAISGVIIATALILNAFFPDEWHPSTSRTQPISSKYSSDYDDNSTDNAAEEKKNSPAPVAFPAHNTVLNYTDATFSNLEINTPSSDNIYYYVKICDSETSQLIQKVYIHSGNPAKLYVPPGTYEIKWTSGETWYGEFLCFNTSSAQKADELFTFDDSHIWTLTLYPVSNGNLSTETIDIDDF